MKNLLLLVHDDDGQEARLQAALDLARGFDGHLNCVDVAILPVLDTDPWSGGAGTAMLPTEEKAREAANRTEIERRLTQEGVAWTWFEATGEIAPCLAKAAALNDLIILNRRLDGLPIPDMHAATAELVVKSGKPVLAVPEKMRGLSVAGRALVAWDGSTEAERALCAAVPLLAKASHVQVLEIEDGSTVGSASDAATYLSRHGIHVVVRAEKGTNRSVAETLLAGIAADRSDYLVMGAYGHSRFAEAIFGGVTKRLLDESPVPLFLVH
ncbi:MAG: universal stress protein [Alphaproteobacteria bacterium]